MNQPIYDIPFRNSSALSDFSCKDGEIAEAVNVMLSSSSGDNLALPTLESPPIPDISFGITRDVLHGWHIATDMYPSKTLSGSSPSIDYWNSLTPQLLAQFQTEALNGNLFVAPFYAMAVWKTVEGSYLSPTQPVLLIPNSEAPLIATDSDISGNDVEFKVAGAVATLCCKFKRNEMIRDWVNRIASLEIFVSEPAHYYNTREIMLPAKRVATENYGLFTNPDTGSVSKVRICSEILPLAWKCNTYIKTKPQELSYFPFASVPLSEVDTMTTWGQPGGITNIDSRTSYKISDITNPQGKRTQSEIITIIGKGREISITTRPVKLSGAGTFKKVRKAFLRGNFIPSQLTFSAYASRDMQNWWRVSTGNTSCLLFPDSYFRFYKFRINGYLSTTQSLQGITLQ